MCGKINGLKRNGVRGQFIWHDQKHCDLCRPPSIVRIVKSRILQWMRRVVQVGQTQSTCYLECCHLENQEESGRIPLRWIFGKYILRLKDKWNWIKVLISCRLWCHWCWILSFCYYSNSWISVNRSGNYLVLLVLNLQVVLWNKQIINWISVVKSWNWLQAAV